MGPCLSQLGPPAGSGNCRSPSCPGGSPGHRVRAGSRSIPPTAGRRCPSMWPGPSPCRRRCAPGHSSDSLPAWSTEYSPSPRRSIDRSYGTVRQRCCDCPRSCRMRSDRRPRLGGPPDRAGEPESAAGRPSSAAENSSVCAVVRRSSARRRRGPTVRSVEAARYPLELLCHRPEQQHTERNEHENDQEPDRA